MGIKAAFKALFAKESEEKKPDPRYNHKFTDEDREASAEIRAIRYEAKLLREKQRLMEAKQELQELREEIEGDEGDEDGDANAQLMTLLAPIISKFNGGAVNLPPPQNTKTIETERLYRPPVALDDETIRDFIKKQPANYIRAAKTLPKPLLYRKIQETLPLSEPEFERAYQILQTEY